MPVPNTAVGSTPSTADDSGERSCRRRHCHSCFFSPTAPPADSALNSAYWPFQSSIDLLRAMDTMDLILTPQHKASPNPGRSRFEQTGRPGKLAAAARSEHTQPTPVPPSATDQPAQGPNQNSTHRKTFASSFKSTTTVCQLSGQIPLDMLP
ncbi:hypothetical protein H9L39_19194 [Fusarium oxysporum f. sp. albedinis]|nr:hypothetical protein H9L39_19194 [Fusarium oxysporum f. sp. albedinis]